MDKPESEKVLLTGTEIREKLGLADRTLSRWFADGLRCKRDAAGRNPRVKLWDLVKFLYEGEENGDEDPDFSGADSPNLERLRKAKADEQERKNAVAMGRLLDADDVAREVRKIANAFRTQMEIVARSRPEIERELRMAIDQASSELEKIFPDQASGDAAPGQEGADVA